MENDLSSAEVQTKIEILPWYAMTTSTCFGQNHTHSSPKSYPFIQKRYQNHTHLSLFKGGPWDLYLKRL